MKFFSRRSILNLPVDIHSHLIPGIDDGAKSIDQVIEMLKALEKIGYEKVITTPHIHPSYPNSPEVILNGLDIVRKAISENGLKIVVEAAAEYFVDEKFLEYVRSEKEILSFGERFVLVESSFMNKPYFFEEALFELQSKGFSPILAHPERYQFLEGSIDWLLELKNMGVLLQVTLGSISGYYGKKPELIAKELLKKGQVDFLGSDLHKLSQIDFMVKGLQAKETQAYLRLGSCMNTML